MTTTDDDTRPDRLPETAVRVSDEQFFAGMNPLDVHPNPTGQWDVGQRGYLSEWKLRDGRTVVGWCDGEGDRSRYWLARP